MVKAIKKKSKKSESEEVQAVTPEVLDGEEGEASFFDDPAVAQTVAEDPLFKFFKKWSNHILGVCVLIFCVWTVVRMLESTHIAAQKSAAQMYAGVRLDVAELKTLDTQLALKNDELAKLADDATADKERLTKEIADIEESRATLITRSQGKVVALKDQKSPYNTIGEMYGILLSSMKADAASTTATVEWSAVPAESPERLFREVTALKLARDGLDSADGKAAAVARLKALAAQGVYMHAMAGKTLAEIAQTAEERQEALTVLQDVLAKHPEQSEIIEQDIQHLENLLS